MPKSEKGSLNLMGGFDSIMLFLPCSFLGIFVQLKISLILYLKEEPSFKPVLDDVFTPLKSAMFID